MSKTWLGIDPGQSGGLSYVCGPDAGAVVMPLHPEQDRKTWGSPIDWFEVFLTLRGWKKPDCHCVIERSQAMPKQGVSSTFKYGTSYGGLLTVLQVLQIPYTLVRPYIWKLRLFGEDNTSGKGVPIKYVEGRWPEVNLRRTSRCRVAHDGMADALCIAAYGELIEHGK